ncbi:MAG: MFS transporter [Pseudomonadota bacterium]
MKERLVIALFLAASLLVAGSYGMILMLPLRVQELGGDARDVGTLQLIIGGVAIATILVSGRMSDRIGQISSLALGACLVAIGLVLFVLTRDLGAGAWAASLLYGLGWGLYFAFKLSVLARLTTAETRFRVYALLSVAVMLGFGLWPVWGAAVTRATGDVSMAFLISAGLCVAGGIIYQVLRVPIRALSGPAAQTDAIRWDGVAAILRSPAWLPIALTFTTACVFSGMNAFQAIFAQSRGLDYAWFFFAYTVSAVVFRLILSPFFAPRNAWRMTLVLYTIMAGSALLFAFSGGNQILYVLVGVGFGLGYGVSSPIVQTLGANEAPPAVVAQSLQFLVIGHLTGVFGFPLIAGQLLVLASEASVIAVMIGFCVLALSGAIYGLRRDIRTRSTQNARSDTCNKQEKPA